MNETITQGVIAAIIDAMVEQSPSTAAALKPRLEAVASKAKESGWTHEAELVGVLIRRLTV